MGNLTRRDFMAKTTVAAAALGAGIYGSDSLAASKKIRRPRKIKPGKKLNVACIGIAGKGSSDSQAMIGENIVAICDVDENNLNTAKVLKNFPKAKRYTDYRQMLEEMDEQIDAVTVSTPDHTHYPAAMAAIERGKHVYVQKPLTHTIWEARALTLAARKHGVATQMGNQGHANEGNRILQEWLQAGIIGDVHEVHVWTDRPTAWGEPAGMDRPTDTPPVPDGLDWDLWLGTAPKRPYHPLYMPKKWRSWWDYGCGALGDMACHIMDASYWALNLGYPSSVEATSSSVNNETIPKSSKITYQFPKRDGMPPVKMVWYDGGNMPKRPKELEPGRKLVSNVGGQLIYGDKGTIMIDAYCKSLRVIPEKKMQELAPKLPPKTIPRSIGHYEEWIRACKGGEPAMSNFDYAGPFTEVVQLGNIALRTGKKICFDPDKFKITNDSDANKYLTHPYRKF